MLVREGLERFERGLIGQGASRNTIATYMRNLARFQELYNDRAVEEITTADLNEFLFRVHLKEDGTEKTPRTMNSIKTALKSFFRFLPLKEDPSKKIRIKRVRIERDYITSDEVRELITRISSIRDRTLVAMLCLLGLRREEVAHMTIADIRGPAVRILGKGGVERDVPINSTTKDLLKKFLAWKKKHGEPLNPDAPLFISRKGNQLSMNAIYNLVRKWTLEILKKELYPHSLRHTFATMLVSKNVHLATIQRLMGHASISMTEVYLHISNELKTEAVNRLEI